MSEVTLDSMIASYEALAGVLAASDIKAKSVADDLACLRAARDRIATAETRADKSDSDYAMIRRVRDGLIKQLGDERALTHQHEKTIRAQAVELASARDRIAELQRQVEAARAEEREACAKVCETCNIHDEGESRTSKKHIRIDARWVAIHVDNKEVARERIAAAIRARGKA